MNDLLGIVSLLIAIVSYGLYITHTLRGSTKPHAITWLVWSLLHGFVFFEQLSVGAGPGAWVTAGASVANFVIFLLALVKGERTMTRLDWICLVLTVILLLSWSQIGDPTIAVFLAVAIFLIGFVPTLRKSTRRAHEETATTYGLNALKFFIAIAALSSFSVASVLYPLVLGVVNGGFALYLIVARRYQVPRKGVMTRGTKKTGRR